MIIVFRLKVYIVILLYKAPRKKGKKIHSKTSKQNAESCNHRISKEKVKIKASERIHSAPEF